MKKNILYILLAFMLINCGPQRIEPVVEESAPVQESSEIEAESTGAFEIDENSEGLIVYLSGDVILYRDGEESYLDIGDSVTQQDIIETSDDAYCEIQLGEIAVVRMESNSSIQLETLIASADGNRMKLDLESGTVLCKVQKLLKEDSFQVQTNTVVCGVRGTQFSISSGDSENLVLAVKEGAVAVTPSALAKVSDLARDEESLAPLAAKIDESVLVVAASEELAVQADTFEDIDELTQLAEKVVLKIEEKQKAETVLSESKDSGDDADDAELSKLTELEESVLQEVASLMIVLDETPEVLQPVGLEVQEISEESLESLKPTDAMELISLPLSNVSSETRAPDLYKIQIKTEPAQAVIYQDGQALAVGQFSKLYAEGSEVNLEIRLDDYETQKLNFIVNDESPLNYPVLLTSTIALSAGTVMEQPQQIEPDSLETEEDLPVQLYPLEITTYPADALLKVDGILIEGSVLQAEMEEGAELLVEVSRNGYESHTETVSVDPARLSSHIRLEARPVEVKRSMGIQAPVAVLSQAGNQFFTADAGGTVSSFNDKGTLLWTSVSKNSPNANSFPIVHNGRVYFSGGSEIQVLNAKNGNVLQSIPLPEERSHIYGRRVLPLADSLLFPANDEIVVMDRSGKDLRTIEIESGSSMSPALWNGNVIIADKKGRLLIMDPDSGNLLSSIQSSAVQSVAQSPSVYKDKAVFCSRKGVVAAFDLNNGMLLWERKLNTTVFADVIVSAEGCYVYTSKDDFFALSWDDGSDLFTALSAVSALPAYSKGLLVYTNSEGSMNIIDASDGSMMKSLPLGDSFAAQPLFRDHLVIAVGEKGDFYRINTEGIEE